MDGKRSEKDEFILRVTDSYRRVNSSRKTEELLNGKSKKAIYMNIVEDMLKEQLPNENISNSNSTIR